MVTPDNDYRRKIKTRDELLAVIGTRPRERKVIMCHGAFDLVHPGHLRHLMYAKSKADLLVAQTLAHVACVAILQEHPPTPDTVMPQLRSALAGRVVVEQAKGFLRESVNVSVEDAFRLLRTYAHTNNEHLTEVARRLMSDRAARPELVAAMAEKSRVR